MWKSLTSNKHRKHFTDKDNNQSNMKCTQKNLNQNYLFKFRIDKVFINKSISFKKTQQ